MQHLCENCGRRFDAELTNGVCPYCGRYSQRRTEDENLPQEEVQPEIQEMEPILESEPVEELVAVPERPARASRRSWILCLIFGLVILIEAIAFPIAVNRVEQKQEIQSYVPLAPEKMLEEGEAFAIGPEHRSVTLGDGFILDKKQGVQPGCVLAGVFCRVEKQNKYHSEWNARIYAQVEDVYYPQLSEYELERVYPELSTEMLDMNGMSAPHMDEGWVYFVLPEDTEEIIFWIQEQQYNRDYKIESVQMLGQNVRLSKGGAAE